MPIQKHSSLLVADKVLKEFRAVLRKQQDHDRWQIECWANAWGQGYHLLNLEAPNRAVNFGEHRGANWVAVVGGDHIEFDPVTNNPSLLIRKDSTIIFETAREAAEYIYSFLTGRSVSIA